MGTQPCRQHDTYLMGFARIPTVLFFFRRDKELSQETEANRGHGVGGTTSGSFRTRPLFISCQRSSSLVLASVSLPASQPGNNSEVSGRSCGNGIDQLY